MTRLWHSFHAVPVSVSTSHAAIQHVVHPHPIASTRDTRYQVHNKKTSTQQEGYPLVDLGRARTWHTGSWDHEYNTHGIVTSYSTHLCYSFHAVPVSVSKSYTATQHVHPRTIASTRDNRYQSTSHAATQHAVHPQTITSTRDIPGTRYIQVGYPLAKLSQVVSYIWRWCTDGSLYPLSRIDP